MVKGSQVDTGAWVRSKLKIKPHIHLGSGVFAYLRVLRQSLGT